MGMGCHFLLQWDLPKPGSPALQADFLPSEPRLSPIFWLINWLIAIHVAPWIYYTLDYNSVLLYFVVQNSRKIVLVFFQKFWYFFPKTNHYFFKYFFSLFFHWRNNMLIESESEVTQSCLTLFDPMDCSLPGSSVHGIFQARVLEWVVIFFSKESSWPKDWTWVSCIAGRSFTVWATREA